jgi:hypothetical protein
MKTNLLRPLLLLTACALLPSPSFAQNNKKIIHEKVAAAEVANVLPDARTPGIDARLERIRLQIEQGKKNRKLPAFPRATRERAQPRRAQAMRLPDKPQKTPCYTPGHACF